MLAIFCTLLRAGLKVSLEEFIPPYVYVDIEGACIRELTPKTDWVVGYKVTEEFEFKIKLLSIIIKVMPNNANRIL